MSSVYLNSILTTTLQLHITQIGNRIKQNLETKLRYKIANKCIEEGFVSPNGIEIIQYSSGQITSDYIKYHVVYSCWIAHPIDGMTIECSVKTITKAGIHAQVIDKRGNIPVTVFVARDHNHMDPMFSEVKEGEQIMVEVIGTRYELNDPYICAIGNLSKTAVPKKNGQKHGQKYGQKGGNVGMNLILGGDE
jgi:DNA-directed RNA polymerase subunit E'/Rpb7